jgi:hypothetical protein
MPAILCVHNLLNLTYTLYSCLQGITSRCSWDTTLMHHIKTTTGPAFQEKISLPPTSHKPPLHSLAQSLPPPTDTTAYHRRQWPSESPIPGRQQSPVRKDPSHDQTQFRDTNQRAAQPHEEMRHHQGRRLYTDNRHAPPSFDDQRQLHYPAALQVSIGVTRQPPTSRVRPTLHHVATGNVAKGVHSLVNTVFGGNYDRKHGTGAPVDPQTRLEQKEGQLVISRARSVHPRQITTARPTHPLHPLHLVRVGATANSPTLVAEQLLSTRADAGTVGSLAHVIHTACTVTPRVLVPHPPNASMYKRPRFLVGGQVMDGPNGMECPTAQCASRLARFHTNSTTQPKEGAHKSRRPGNFTLVDEAFQLNDAITNQLIWNILRSPHHTHRQWTHCGHSERRSERIMSFARARKCVCLTMAGPIHPTELYSREPTDRECPRVTSMSGGCGERAPVPLQCLEGGVNEHPFSEIYDRYKDGQRGHMAQTYGRARLGRRSNQTGKQTFEATKTGKSTA